MKNRLKLSFILAAVTAVSILYFQPAQFAQTQTPPVAVQVQTAGQKFKNIKVLNDMPADQLGKVMNIYAASLGVNCDFCHMGNDFAKDGKEEKETAREMITMTLGINKASFKGRPEVSCNTCHNGHGHPQSAINLWPSAAVERPKQPEKKPLPEDIIAKYVQAVGGAEKIAAIKSRVLTISRIEADDKTTEPETISFKDGKYVSKTTYGERWVTDLWDGSKAWKFARYQQFDTHEDENEQIKREADLFMPINLTATYPKLEFRFLDRLDGHEVYILNGTTASNVTERLYFDVVTGLLVRRIATTRTMFGGFNYQVDYADYKEFDGVKVPTTIRYAMPNIRWTKKVTGVKNNAAIDDAVFQFVKPEARPTPKQS